MEGKTGEEKKILSLSSLKEGDEGRYVFDRATKLSPSRSPRHFGPGCRRNGPRPGNLDLFSDEPIYTNDAVVPKGVRLPPRA